MSELTPISVCLENFQSTGEFDRFDAWVSAPCKRTWTEELAWRSVMWVMITKGYSSAYQVKFNDVKKFSRTGAFTKHSNFSSLVLHVANTRQIDIGDGNYKKPNSTLDEQEHFFQNIGMDAASVYTPNEQEMRLMANVTEQLNQVPLIIEKLSDKSTMYDCQIDQSRLNLIFLGVVYVICVKSSNDILYVGSSDSFKERIKTHRTNSAKSTHPMYKYIRENQLSFDNDLHVMIVMTCVAGYGFEVFLEDSFYQKLYQNKKFLMLANGNQRPSCTNLSDIGYIYRCDQITRHCEQTRYVGQSADIHSRIYQHKYKCYDTKDSNNHKNKLLYHEARSINKITWPKDVLKFAVIEKCPVWMMNKREVHWIDKMNTFVPNGLNAVLPIVSIDQLTCKHCSLILCPSSSMKLHLSICKSNPDRST